MGDAEVFSLVIVLFIAILGVLATIFWIWMLVDCAVNEPSTGNDKIIWILVILLAGFLGALVYYFARRPQRMRLVGK